jgi:hypothetical protein
MGLGKEILQEERMFLSEEKNQKTFASLARAAGQNRDSDQKFFAPFLKKEALAPSHHFNCPRLAHL